MPSLLPGFEYDIFISYRQNDNRSGWVTEFVKALQEELAATIKDPISVYFDSNPHDGLLETHNVGKSLEGKLKCLIFIPIVSQTYCDPKSFVWQYEFVAFNRMAKEDQFGRDIKLANSNVTSRILPVKIHDLDAEDKATLESELGGVLRAIEFIYKESGVNRQLKLEDKDEKNLSKTSYPNQVNKVANAVKEIIHALTHPASAPSDKSSVAVHPATVSRKALVLGVLGIMMLFALGFAVSQFMSSSPQEPVKRDTSIAVLPFANMSNDPEQEYFSDGITEQIITNLAHINSLKVIGRTSSMKFKKTNKTIKEIGNELGVTHVLEGSIRRSGDRIRVTAQLISVQDESHIWAQDFDKGITDIFTVQDEISMAIANSLERELTPRETESIKSERSTNVEAYEHFLKGYHIHLELYYIKRLKEDFFDAEREFKSSIQLDTTYAPAYAGLADLYDTYRNTFPIQKEERMKFEALRDHFSKIAMRLSPQNPDVIVVRAYSFQNKEGRTEADIDSAFKLQRKALAIAPGDADVCDALSVNYSSRGLYYQALQLRERSISLDPTYGNYHALLGALLINLGDYQKAERSIQKAILLQPEGLAGLQLWARLKLLTGDMGEAERTIKKVKEINQEAGTTGLESHLLALKGDKEKALSLNKGLDVYLALGMKKEALDIISRNYFAYLYLKHSPVFLGIRNEQAFIQALERNKIVYEERLKKYTDN